MTCTAQYAIHVEGAGWVCGVDGPPFRLSVDSNGEPAVFLDEDNARERARSVGDEYQRLGLPQMRDRISLFKRVESVTITEWSQVLKEAGLSE